MEKDGEGGGGGGGKKTRRRLKNQGGKQISRLRIGTYVFIKLLESN
jgi:hypothetical protein